MNPMQSPNTGVGGKDHGGRQGITQDTEKTRVVFRKYKEGDILALFPNMKGNNYRVGCYQHIGQHGEADYQGCIASTVPATPEEYKDLAAELESIGYNLLIRKRR